MSSPFHVFRRHQKVLMVVFTGLAMFSFIFLDSLQNTGSQSSPIIIGVLFGGFGMWILGLVRGKWLEYALIGAVGGGIAGFMLSFAGQPAPRVTTTIGDFSDEELNDLIMRRRIANQFLEMAFYESRKPEEQEMAQFPQQMLFMYGRPLEEDVILGQILKHEAEDLGLTVSDEAVSQYINQVTTNQLSQTKFNKVVRQDMRIGSAQLFDILRDELLARLALEMTAPRILQTPEQYWEYYRRFNVKQELELTAVPVSAFTDQIEPPTDQEVIELFEKYKAVFPDQLAPGTPGFRQPRKISLAYVEARPQPLEAEIKPVTDDEIEQYYNENKELYRELSTDLLDNSMRGDDPFATDPPAENEKPDAGTEAPSTDAPSDEPSSEEPAADEPPADDTPSEEDAPPTEETESTDGEDAANFSVNDNIEKLTVAQNETENSTDVPPNDESATETESDDAPPSEASLPSEENVSADESKSASEESTYRPLDDDLRSEIRSEIRRRRLRELVDEKMAKVRLHMTELAEQRRFPEEGEEPLSKEEMAERLKAFAEKNKLTYGEVPLASFEDLGNVDRYPVGSAEEPSDNPMAFEEPTSVRVNFFQAGADELFTPFLANDPLTDVAYAAWKTGDVADQVPTLDDPGIREQVIEAWKIEKAKPLAEKRAQELVELLKTSPLPWSEALADETVTGDDEGLQLTVQTTEQFSWMRTTTAPSSNMFSLPEPVLSTISTVENAGSDFMRTVFRELEPREVGAVPNADRSTFYVVKVRNRFPSTAEELATLREQFFREGQEFFSFFSPYSMLANREQQEVFAEWSRQLEEKYDVLWRQVEPGETAEPLPAGM